MEEMERKIPSVLVVDDDPADAMIIRGWLEGIGLSVSTVLSAEEAAKTLTGKLADLIILDWMMPNMTGLEFLKKLGANPQWRAVPVIMVTAKQSSHSLDQSLSEGARDYIRKPVDGLELTARVKAALKEKDIQDQLSRANQELLKLCQVKDDYLSSFTHDVRAPLNSIVGFSDFLLEGKMGELNDKQARMVEVIKKSARIQLDLMENLLEAARLNSGRVVLRLRPADLAGIALECLEGIRPSAERKNIELVFTAGNETAMVMVDDLRIVQVLNNLIGNAIKFTPRGGRVEVTVSGDMKGGVLMVRDNGPGIPEEELPKIFNRFEQTKIKSTAGESGFGLGLSIVKSIVEMHNGRVWVECKPGEGAQFFVSLPMVRAAQPATIPQT